MNHKLKIQLIALMAFISGTALGNCQAMQVDANLTPAVGNGVVRPADPGLKGTVFGTVKSALPIADYGTIDVLPPIVSPASAVKNSVPRQHVSLPPIVSPVSKHEVRRQPASVKTELAILKTNFTPVKTASISKNMLAPLAPQTPADMMLETSSHTYSPAPIIRTTGQTTSSETDRQVQHASQWNPQIQNGISSAGVPLYSKATAAGFFEPQQSLPPIVSGSLVPPIAQGGNGPMPRIVQAKSQLTAPDAVAPYPSAPLMMEPVYADPSMNQTYFNSTPMEAPVITSGGCNSCGGGGCNSCGSGGCNSCGGGGCTDCGVAMSTGADLSGCQSCGTNGCFDQSQVDARFAACGSVYNARRYLIADVLYMDRNDGSVAISNFGGLGNFEEELGWRVTLGTRDDATRGRELSYFGTDEITQNRTVTDPAGRISIGVANTGGFAITELSAFRNAVSQTQSKATDFHSLEFNKVRWGWDVVKSFIGVRYIYVEDEYNIASTNFGGETGTFQMQTHNNLLGGHIGSELFYDVGYRISASFSHKWGLYVNPNKVDTRLVNSGAEFLNLDDTNTALSGSIELALTGHYQISEQARFRFGYNALWLGNVASVSDNLPTFLSPTTGTDTSDTDDMFFHGISGGIEIYR